MPSLLSRIFCRREPLPATLRIEMVGTPARRGDTVLLTTSQRLSSLRRQQVRDWLLAETERTGVEFRVMDGADWRATVISGSTPPAATHTQPGGPR